MSLGRVVIVGADWDGRRLAPGDWSLWYFGNDYNRFLEVAAKAGRDDFVSADLVNRMARQIRTQMIEVDELLLTGPTPLPWLASDLLERNPLTSDFYLDVSRALALVESVREGGQHLVVVDDAALGRALIKLCNGAGLAATGFGLSGSLYRRLTGALRAHGGFLRGWLRERRALAKYKSNPRVLADRPLWLMTWETPSTQEIKSNDAFFGELPVWLRDTGVKFGWLANPAAWMHPIADIVQSVERSSKNDPNVLVGAFTGMGGLLRAYAGLLTLRLSLRHRIIVRDVEISDLVGLAISRERASPRVIAAVLYAGVAAGIRRMGFAPRAVFYTYENQPWEKALLHGFRKALPDTKMIGVQHAPLAENYLSAQPTRRQWGEGTAPDVLVAVGEEFYDRLIEERAPPARVTTGGALRFPSLNAKSTGDRIRPVGTPAIVLASCAMDYRESFELAHKAAIATAGMNVRLLVNFHPMVAAEFRQQVRERVNKIASCRHVEFVEGSAEKWLEQSDVLLYSASGVAFEAAAAGVPAIFVSSDLALDLDKMSGQSGVQCRTPSEIRVQIETLLKDSSVRERVLNKARAHARRCFGTPQREFWIAFAKERIEVGPAQNPVSVSTSRSAAA